MCLRCRHTGFLIPKQSPELIHFPLGKHQYRETQGRVANTCSSCSFLSVHLHGPGGAPFPGAGGNSSNPAPHGLPHHEPRLDPVAHSGAASTFEQNRTKGYRTTYPFDEESLLQHSSFLLHFGQRGREPSPCREAPKPWQPVPLHTICLRKLIFLCYPPPK